MSLQETKVKTSHGEVFVKESSGGGTPVFLIHGNSSSSVIFRNQMEGRLGKKYRLIAIDLPGHGRSSDSGDPERSYCMEGYADAIAETAGLLGIEKAGAVGWSLGGHIGLELISRFPGLLGLVITGTPPVAPNEIDIGFKNTHDVGLAAQRDFSDADAEQFARSACGEPFETPLLDAARRADGRTRHIMWRKFREGSGDNQREIVANAKIPIAVINGSDEAFIDLGFVSRVKFGNLWESKTHLIDGGGHAPFWSKPKEYDIYLERFIEHIGC